jgi:hypothetical protein
MASSVAAGAAVAVAGAGNAAVEEDVWVFPENREYKGYLVHFMSFLHNRLVDKYPNDAVFSKEELLAIQPHHIRKWMNLRAYGMINPPDNAIVLNFRSNSLLKAKQAISFFMPNKHVPWLDGSNGHPSGGNPTRHKSISDLIKKVKKKECRGQGRKANDKRAYSRAEFNKVLELFREQDDWDHQYKYPMMALWAYRLI